MARPGTGPSPARPAGGPGTGGLNGSSTGPQAVRPGHGTGHGTGPIPARHATGPHPAHSARPAAGLAQPGLAQPGHAQSSLTQPTVAQPALGHPGAALPGSAQSAPAQPSFSPNTGRNPSRQPEHGDWGERTERIDRISTGYPDPRANGRGQAPAASIWGRDDSAERQAPDGRRRGADDDPLTSKAFSRDALLNTDGRSYRVASRRAQQVPPDRYDAALTEQTQTFSVNGQYGADPQAATARYPARGGQQPGTQPSSQAGSSSGPQPGLRSGAQPGQHAARHGGHQQSRQSRQASDPYGRGYPYPSQNQGQNQSQPYQPRPAAADQDEERYGRGRRSAGRDQGHNGHNGHNGGNSAYGGNANGYSASGYSAPGYADNGRSNGRGGRGDGRY
jgi:hypothetical protein